MVLGYIRIVDMKPVSILSKTEQLTKLKLHKCDGIVTEEDIERVSTSVTDRLSAGDTLVIASLNILGKMTVENLEYIDKLLDKGVIINILDLGLIESRASDVYILLQTFHKYEKSCLQERLYTAKKVAKQRPGFKEGRPRTYSDKQIEEGIKLLDKHSYAEAAKICGISVATLNREKKKREKALLEKEMKK